MTNGSTSLGKLLLIDSNVLFAKRVAGALRDLGFDVTHSLDAAYALTMLEYDTPDAVLCATNLREMNAFDIVPLIHGDAKTSRTAVVALCDSSSGEHGLIQAFRAGCDDCVDRNIGPENIATHVRNFLRSREEGFQPTQMLDGSMTSLEGNLSQIDLPGIIQMLSHSRQTGSLHINAGENGETDGIIVFDQGQLSHAEMGQLTGDAAVIQIVKSCNRAEKGVYKFIHGYAPATRSVHKSATELMLQALREIDETQQVSDEGVLL